MAMRRLLSLPADPGDSRIRRLSAVISFTRSARFKARPRKPPPAPPPPPPPPPPPLPPRPPKKPEPFTFHGVTWEDPYSWMSHLTDKVAMRHMTMYMEQEEKYTEAVMLDTERLQSKLHSEMVPYMPIKLCSTPIRWGPWLYYRRLEEGKPYPVLCRRSASLHDEFISNKSPSAGFDFMTGIKIEQKLIDHNEEAERFGGYPYEAVSEVSPDHRFIAYAMFDKEKDYNRLSVKDLNSGALLSTPQADRISNLAWAKDGKALLYAVTNHDGRPYRIYCSMIGTNEKDVILLDESDKNVSISIRHTKDFKFVTVNTFSVTSFKVFLINAADPLSGMTLVWDCGTPCHCAIEHHQGFLYLFTDAPKDGRPVDSHYLQRRPVETSINFRNWENVFIDDPDLVIEDVDFNDKHLALILREGRKFRLCSIALPLPRIKGSIPLKDNLHFLPLPKNVCQISPEPNYDYYSSTMRFTVSSPVMPDAVVDYDLSDGKWNIIEQDDLLYERTQILYGSTSDISYANSSTSEKSGSKNEIDYNDELLWNDLSEFYACECYDVCSFDGALVPLTIVYSRRNKKEDKGPGLLHVHGAYGVLLDKRWCGELKSLLDRGWVVSYADVRGGGGGGRKWHHDGRRTKKHNSIQDYIACAKFLIEKGIVHEDKLAGCGYSAGGLTVASAVNSYPDLFRAAVLKVPFLDPTNTLLYPILRLTAHDYEEFGYPWDVEEDFQTIREYSPYDNIKKDVQYPAVLVTATSGSRFGVWEATKWVTRVRECTIYDPQRPVLLSSLGLIADVDENRYLHCQEVALANAFLIKVMDF